MLNHRIRILSSLLIAFIIVNIYGNFTGIKDALANFKFPTYNFGKLFTLNFDSQPQIGSENPTPTYVAGSINYKYISPIPTIKGLGNPTPTSIINHPSSIISKNPTPTIKAPTKIITPTKIPTKIPTNKPKPTNTPKPTKTPTPPPITSDIRPGTSLMTIFQEVGKRACIPAALLMAFKTEETGERFKNDSATTIKIYNTYGWWQTGTGDPCYGYGYNTATGFVPSDSVSAGTHCWGGAGGADLKIMGLLQISEEEETLTRKYTKKTLPNNIDRRVFFDNALIFAIATNNRIGVTPKSCTVWTDDEVKIAAEKHYGSCYISATRNYCNEVLNLYKQYR